MDDWKQAYNFEFINLLALSKIQSLEFLINLHAAFNQ